MEFTLDKLKACISNYYLFDDFQVLACKLSYSIYNTKKKTQNRIIYDFAENWDSVSGTNWDSKIRIFNVYLPNI